MHILQLPTDIIIIIISHVSSAKDLCVCNQVCKPIYNLFRSSPRLYHQWLLARAGLADSYYGIHHVSLTDRSKLVTGLERIWHPQLLLSRRQLKITLENPCVNYQVCNGAIIVGMLSPTGHSLHELQVYRLPSYLTGLKSKLWKHKIAADANINQFKVDPGQDLLVLVGMSTGVPSQFKHSDNSILNIHLRTLSGNKEHPAAASACLSLTQFSPKEHFQALSGHLRARTIVRIYCDILGILSKSGQGDPTSSTISHVLMVWQWTSGQRLVVFSPPSDLYVDDFTFIDRETLLLTHSSTPSGPAITTMRVPCGLPYSKYPDPLPIDPSLGSPTTLSFFQLPVPPRCPSGCLAMGGIEILNDPITDSSQALIDGNSVPNIFCSNPATESTIIAFSLPINLHFNTAHEAIISHVLLVRASIFSLLSKQLLGPTKRYAFPEWSAQGVYWFTGQPGCIYGQRYAHTSPDDPRTNVEVYDFNPCHVESPAVSGWQTLLKTGKVKPPPLIVPKLNSFKWRGQCKYGHKRYLDSDLKSTMPCKRQVMKAGVTEADVGCALDNERVVIVELERGGFVHGFTAYNI